MHRGVGQRQAARDHEIGGSESQQRQHNELSAPAGGQVFQHAGRTAAIGRTTDHVPVNRQRQEECDQHDSARGHRRQRPRRLGGNRRQVSQRAEIVDAYQAQYQRPGIRGLDRARAADFRHGKSRVPATRWSENECVTMLTSERLTRTGSIRRGGSSVREAWASTRSGTSQLGGILAVSSAFHQPRPSSRPCQRPREA